MKTLNALPEAACVTIETFEELIAMDERRRKELLAELTALRVRERVIGATQDATWVTLRFIEPRLAELRAVEARITVLREKLTRLLAQWTKPVPRPPAPPTQMWFDPGHPAMLALTA